MTVFEKMTKEITPEGLARTLVKTCVVDRNNLFYVTTTGQLMPYTDEGYENAVKLQLQFLNSTFEGTESDSKESEKQPEQKEKEEIENAWYHKYD